MFSVKRRIGIGLRTKRHDVDTGIRDIYRGNYRVAYGPALPGGSVVISQTNISPADIKSLLKTLDREDGGFYPNRQVTFEAQVQRERQQRIIT